MKALWQKIKATLLTRETISYIIVGGLSTVANWIATYILNNVFHWGYWLTSIVTFSVGMIFTFVANRKFTFRSDVPLARQMLLVALYYVVFIPASAWWGDLLQHQAGWPAWGIEILNMVVNFVTEFIYQKFIVFRNTK